MAVLIAVSVRHPVDERELSEERRFKAAQFKKKEDRVRCLCAGAALDAALKTVGLRERTAVVAVNEHGKPFLREYPTLHFSLSHGGDWAICALSDAPVGADVEQLRPLAFMPLAQRFFTHQEAAVLGRLPEKEQQRAFFRLWTAKESLLKALGTGLSRPLSSVPVMLGETLTTPVEGFTLGEYPLDGYQLTVCSKAPLPDSVHIME